MRQLIAPAVIATALAVLVTAPSAQTERGRLLYENHCAECHTTEVHFREKRKAQSLDDVREWVLRWQAELELDWTGADVDDVARYLNGRYYQFVVAD